MKDFQDVFGEDVKCIKVISKDLGGLDLKGSIFYLFEYQFEHNELRRIFRDASVSQYPAEYRIYGNRPLIKTDTVYGVKRWTRLPVKTNQDSLYNTFDYLNVQNEISDFDKVFTSSSNFYAYIVSKRYGNLFYLADVDHSILYVVVKNP